MYLSPFAIIFIIWLLAQNNCGCPNATRDTSLDWIGYVVLGIVGLVIVGLILFVLGSIPAAVYGVMGAIVAICVGWVRGTNYLRTKHPEVWDFLKSFCLALAVIDIVCAIIFGLLPSVAAALPDPLVGGVMLLAMIAAEVVIMRAVFKWLVR